MNDQRSPDRLLSIWFESEAPVSAPDALRTDIYRATAAIRPRPAWLARLRGNPMDVIAGGASRRNSRLVPVAALLLLVLALIAGAALVGGWLERKDLAVVPSTLPTASPTPAGLSAAPAFTQYADLAVSMPYPIVQVQAGALVGIAGPDTNELLRSVHRVNITEHTSSVIIDNIPVGPSDHVSFAPYGGTIVIGHDEGGRALRFDTQTGELMGETPLGDRPLEPVAWDGAVAFPNFGDGSVTVMNPSTGDIEATVEIAAFNGAGPLSLTQGANGIWAVSPSAPVLVGLGRIGSAEDLIGTPGVSVEAALPGGPHCGVGFVSSRYWVTTCDSPTVVVLPDTYTSSSDPMTVNVAPGVLAPVFEAGGSVWFPTEDRSTPDWTTKLVPVDSDTLIVGEPLDLGAQVGVVRTNERVWIVSGKDLYLLRPDALPASNLGEPMSVPAN